MIERWLILISGFTQSRARPCGIESLWLGLRRIASPATSVQIHSWNNDFDALARFIARCSAPMPRIDVAGYSWGGNAAVELAGHLDRQQVPVNQLLLCDAVRRTPLMPRWAPLSVLSMTRLLTLTVPANVASCTYFTQRRNRPAGHRVIAASRRTRITYGGELRRRHEDMDEAPEFAAACAAAAEL